MLAAPSPSRPNAFLRIGTDNTVTVTLKHLEMGGAPTRLATLVAEELDADWKTIARRRRPGRCQTLQQPLLGPGPGYRQQYRHGELPSEQMRKASAAARAMLRAPPPSSGRCRPTADRGARGTASSATCLNHRAAFGGTAKGRGQGACSARGHAEGPRRTSDLIGKKADRRDHADKTNGKAQYTLDVRLPACWWRWSPIRRASRPR